MVKTSDSQFIESVYKDRADGSQAWVNLDSEGAPTFLRDYASGGTKGAIHVGKREPQPLTHPAMVRAPFARGRCAGCCCVGCCVGGCCGCWARHGGWPLCSPW